MIILASQSPYRKSLMEKTGYSFQTEKPKVNEEALKKEYSGDLKELIQFLAFKKAESLKEVFKNAIIIGSDQALIFKDELIGKGHDHEGSKRQLLSLSNQSVELVTAVTLISNDKRIDFSNVTELKFKALSEELIEWYLKKDEPYDCAGSFKMESSGALLFEYVRCTDPTAIQGLPLMRLVFEIEALKKGERV